MHLTNRLRAGSQACFESLTYLGSSIFSLIPSEEEKVEDSRIPSALPYLSVPCVSSLSGHLPPPPTFPLELRVAASNRPGKLY